MDILKGLRRCQFCGVRNDNLKYVNRVGLYGEAGWNWAYHQKCLKDVSCEPEKHGTKKADMAIEIIDCIKHWNEKSERTKKRAIERCEYLKEHCV